MELYRSMLQIGQTLPGNADSLPEVRIALLADHAPQQLTKVLACAVLEQGLFPLLYAADYGTAAFHAVDSASEAHTFRPEFVVYSTAVQKYRDRFYAATSAQDRDTLPETYLGEV